MGLVSPQVQNCVVVLVAFHLFFFFFLSSEMGIAKRERYLIQHLIKPKQEISYLIGTDFFIMSLSLRCRCMHQRKMPACSQLVWLINF